jgi:DNA-binding SARP family transcriptional activator
MDAPVTGPEVEFRAFGTPRLSRSGVEVQSVLARPKLLGLLSFLAFSSSGFHRRDSLLGLFWAESDQKRARRALRQSLYYLRQSLGAHVLVARGEEELALDEARLWSDVRAFEVALEDGRTEEALELYQGDLLAGFFVANAPEYERWLDGRREALRRRASDAAWSLAEAAAEDRNAAAACHWARHATALEPFDERGIAQAIELLDRMGDRSGALSLYEAFGRRLAQEFDIEPAPETQALVAEIRGRVGAAEEPNPDAAAPQPDAPGSTSATDPTAEPPPEGSAAPHDPAPSEPPPSPWFRRPGRVAALIGVIGAATGVALVQLLGTGRPTMDPGRVVVAVFENRTGDGGLDPLGRMAADWITQALHESGVVEVVPSTIELAPRPDFTDGAQPNATALAEATEAGTVVVGAYYRRGDSIEIQAQVINASEGNLLSALPPVGSPLGAPGVAVDSLSRSMVRTLAVLSEPSLASSADLRRPPSLDAYRQYLEGLRNFRHIPLRMRESLPYFYRAIALDSGFLAPRFYIIMAHANLNEFALADSNAQALATRRLRLSESQQHMLDWMVARMSGNQMDALEAARARGGMDVGVQALVVNRPAEAVEVLSAITPLPYFHRLALMEAYHVLGDYRSELDEARRGRDAYPGLLRMLDAELRALAALGRASETGRVLDEALVLPDEEPVTAGALMVHAAAELRAHGHREASTVVAERAIAWWIARPEENVADLPTHLDRALAYYYAERWEDADRVLRELSSEAPEALDVMGYLGTLAARRGDRTEALAISARLGGRAIPPEFGGDLYRQARIAAQLGDREGAVAFLRDALSRGMAYGIWLHRDMDLEPLRGFEPFEELLRPKG